jgi:peptidoglycan glycosyltransferase
MNRQVSHVGVAALVLLAALIVGTTYWQTWANASLADRQDNEIRLVAQFSIKRGKIYGANGRTVLARNVTKKAGGQTLYFRRYPTGPLFADVVGYSTQSRNRTGIEQSYNDYLTGSNANLDTVFRSALDKLKGTTVKGTISCSPSVPVRRQWRTACCAASAERSSHSSRPRDACW